MNCFGMTFDGASSFNNNSVGVDARNNDLALSATRTHCHMHCVNLAGDVLQCVLSNCSLF